MMKQRGQNADKGAETFSRLEHKHSAHATPYHEQFQKYKIDGVDYAQNVHIELNTSLPVQDMGIVFHCASGTTATDEFCEGFACRAIEHVTFKCAGRTILEYDYADALVAAVQSFKYEQDIAQLKLIAGGPKGTAARTCIAPLFFFNDSISFGEEVAHRRPWCNPQGHKLEIELRLAAKADCTSGAGMAIENCEFIYSELLLPAGTEAQLKTPIAVTPRSIYRSLPEFSVAANTVHISRLESMTAAGNVKNIWCYARANKGTGKEREWPDGNAVHPSAIKLKINGTVVLEQTAEEVEWRRWISGQNVRANKAHIISFAERPYCKRSSSGFLPANLDAVSLELTFPTAVDCRLIFELEKVLRADGMSRYTQSDK